MKKPKLYRNFLRYPQHGYYTRRVRVAIVPREPDDKKGHDIFIVYSARTKHQLGVVTHHAHHGWTFHPRQDCRMGWKTLEDVSSFLFHQDGTSKVIHLG